MTYLCLNFIILADGDDVFSMDLFASLASWDLKILLLLFATKIPT